MPRSLAGRDILKRKLHRYCASSSESTRLDAGISQGAKYMVRNMHAARLDAAGALLAALSSCLIAARIRLQPPRKGGFRHKPNTAAPVASPREAWLPAQ